MGTRVLVVDDQPVARLGLSTLFGRASDVEIVAEAGTVAEARAALEYAPDVVLLDVVLPDGNGLDLIPDVRARLPRARVVVIARGGLDGVIRQALRAGAAACVTKEMPLDEILTAVREVGAGRRFMPKAVTALLADEGGRDLTERETAVLRLMMHGSTNPEIAALLAISAGTVRTHVSHILDKLGVSDRTEAVATALRRGFIVSGA